MLSTFAWRKWLVHLEGPYLSRGTFAEENWRIYIRFSNIVFQLGSCEAAKPLKLLQIPTGTNGAALQQSVLGAVKLIGNLPLKSQSRWFLTTPLNDSVVWIVERFTENMHACMHFSRLILNDADRGYTRILHWWYIAYQSPCGLWPFNARLRTWKLNTAPPRNASTTPFASLHKSLFDNAASAYISEFLMTHVSMLANIT